MKNILLTFILLNSLVIVGQNIQPQIPGTNKNLINPDSLILNPIIKLDSNFQLISLSIEMTCNGGIKEFKQEGLTLKKNILETIKQLKRGNTIIFKITALYEEELYKWYKTFVVK